MNSTRVGSAINRVSYARRVGLGSRFRNASMSLRWLAVMIFFLLAAPKMRIAIGPAPLYIIDAVIALLLFYATRKAAIKTLKPLSSLVAAYLVFVWIGEIRGLIEYGELLEPIYLMGRFTLAISLFFTIPRLVRTGDAASLVLKAIVAGLIFTSIVTILYSLAPTRPLVMKLFFSHDFLVPSAERLAQRTLQMAGVREGLRGMSLIGTSTITTGFLGVMWAFAFLAARWPGLSENWRKAAHIASMAAPLAMLMTYGRAAWLTVIVIGGMAFFFGFARGRRNMFVLAVGLAIIVYQVGWQSDVFMMDVLVKKSQKVVENPHEALPQRLQSFVDPFIHLVENPSWLMAGSGRVGQKLQQRGNIEAQLRTTAGLSNHSGFGMAYYCYGLMAAITNALIMFFGFRLVWRRLQSAPRKSAPLYKITWQVFFMAWVGMLFWWLPGHAMIGEGRGVILFFFFYGLMAAFDNIWTGQEKRWGG